MFSHFAYTNLILLCSEKLSLFHTKASHSASCKFYEKIFFLENEALLGMKVKIFIHQAQEYSYYEITSSNILRETVTEIHNNLTQQAEPIKICPFP